MSKKNKRRKQKGVLLYDTSLFSQAEYRPAGLLALGATACVLHPQSLEELEEPEFFLMTHEQESIRKVGLALHQGKNVYALPAHRIKWCEETDATLLLCMALRKAKYQIRSVPKVTWEDHSRELFIRYLKRICLPDLESARQYNEKWSSYGSSWNRGTTHSGFKELFRCAWRIADQIGTCFVSNDFDKIETEIRLGRYDEQIRSAQDSIVRTFRSIDKTIAYREYYSQFIDFPHGPGSD